MVSSLDSTPARKAPHLEDFCVAGAGDAMIGMGALITFYVIQ